MNLFFFFPLFSFSLLVVASDVDEKQYFEGILKKACTEDQETIDWKVYFYVSDPMTLIPKLKWEEALLGQIYEDLANSRVLPKLTNHRAIPRYVRGLKRKVKSSLKKHYPKMNLSILDTVRTSKQLKEACERLFGIILSNRHLPLGNSNQEAVFRLFYLYISYHENYPKVQTFDLDCDMGEQDEGKSMLRSKNVRREQTPPEIPKAYMKKTQSSEVDIVMEDTKDISADNGELYCPVASLPSFQDLISETYPQTITPSTFNQPLHPVSPPLNSTYNTSSSATFPLNISQFRSEPENDSY